MIARLILALLLAAFAFPAAAPAACHEGKAGVHGMAMEHGAPVREHEATPPHGCIGCVPPSTWIAARTVDVALRDAVPPVARVTTLNIGTGAPPALPPPRAA